ncbi:polysaccharide biosynthesis tyrosine autokinase [Roseobacter sp. HKCCD7906]|uniref:polysaccharide biosynthesis tyrosine autokinase n=1 Tax=Roseobacter sp. HKCCD7906 TaxID=2690562 RepID=UPI001490FE5B|nr:polysaccharide biosynthesis tyrosine autokinase [Roseobacter sp. HKCCD7906]NOA69502.1 polysaccharide biosynthesis tyrosine autokinase [Roseobacter sp. HKCCD7906]
MNQQFVPAPDAEPDDEIDLLALLGTLWRGKWIVLMAAVLSMVLGGVYAFRLAVPLYPATVTVALNAQQQQVITDIESILGGGAWDNVAINTELEVLRSRELVGQLVDRLDLTSDPEFNAALRVRSRFDNLRAAVLAPLQGGPAEEVTSSVRDEVIDTLLQQISASSVRSSLALTISVTTTEPAKSVRIANALAEIYIENQILVKLEALTRATAFLSTRTVELRENLEDVEGQLAAFSEQAEMISPEVLVAQGIQLRELRTRIREQEVRATDMRARLEKLQMLQSQQDVEGFILAADEFRLTRSLTQFRNGRISEAELNAQLDDYLDQLASDAVRNEQQVAALENAEQELSARIQRQSEELIALQQLEREAEAARLLYENFFTRLQETNVQQGLEVADSRIISEAVPRPASSPNKPFVVVLSVVLGALLGSGLVLLREMRFAGFRTSDDLRLQTQKTVLASVPVIPAKDRQATLRYLSDKPNSIVAEAIRNLRTSVLMSNVDKPPRVIMITSSVPGEGKTTLALALSRIMTGMGKKVLLIEADIRRRTFKEYFDTDASVALLDLLLGTVKAEDVDPFVPEVGFDVLTGSKSDVNATDLFTSEKFASLMKGLRTTYDYIIIDTPPVLAVPDARVIGAHADAIIYGVAWDRTTKTQVRQGLDMLDSVGLTITGLVLSQVDQRKMKTYGYGGQYGYDTNGSKYYDQ